MKTGVVLYVIRHGDKDIIHAALGLMRARKSAFLWRFHDLQINMRVEIGKQAANDATTRHLRRF